jgi:hypothetical protein
MKCTRYSVLNTSKNNTYFRYLDCGQQLWIDQRIQGEQFLVVDVVDGNISSANRNVLINLYDSNNLPQISNHTNNLPQISNHTPTTTTQTTEVQNTPQVTPTISTISSSHEMVLNMISTSMWEAYLIGQTFSTINIVGNSTINFVMKPNLNITIGETVLLYYNSENQIIGEIFDYNDKTGAVTLQSSAILGSGTYFIWKVYRV